MLVGVIFTGSLFGCDKDDTTLAKIQELYNTTKDGYIEDNAGVITNSMFKNNLVATGKEGDTAEANQNILHVTFGIASEPIDNNDMTESRLYDLYQFTTDKTKADEVSGATKIVRQKLYQYTSVYQPILTSIFSYYERWNKSFLEMFGESDKLDQKDINNIFYSLQEFSKQLAEFDVQKSIFEQDVVLLGADNAIIGASINVLNSHYNRVILSAFDFINTYADVLNKYYPELEQVSSGTAADYATYSQRLYSQSIIKLAETVFYTNVYSMQSGEYCDISYLLKTSNANVVSGNNLTLLSSFLEQGEGADIELKAPKDISLEQIQSINVLKQNLMQQFNLYKKAYEGFSVHEYKCALYSIEQYNSARTLEDFKKDLTYEQIARMGMINNFETNIIKRYAMEMKNIFIA